MRVRACPGSSLLALLVLGAACGPLQPLAGSGQGEPIACVDRDPIQLTRTRVDAFFDTALGNADLVTDGWRLVAFRLREPLEVQVALLGAGGQPRGVLVPAAELSAGDYAFALSYGEVAGLLGGERDFGVELSARGAGQPARAAARVALAGYLEPLEEGEMIGRVVQHDVHIHSGGLRLRREDVDLGGREPTFGFIRNYENRRGLSAQGGALGPGWTFNHDIRMHVSAWGDEPQPLNLPAWVAAARGRFLRAGEVPADDGRPRRIDVTNGGAFKRVGDEWVVQASFHGALTEEDGGFVFTSKDGTRYRFERPQREPLALCAPPRRRGRVALGPAPFAPVRWIEARAGTRLSYRYAQARDGDWVEEVTDPGGRAVRFEYDPPLGAERGARPRRLRHVLGPDGIALDFEYDDSPERLLVRFARDVFEEHYRYELHPGAGEQPAAAGSPRPHRYRLLACVDANRHETRYTYGGKGVVPALRGAEGFDPETAVTAVIYADGARVQLRYGEGARRDVRTVISASGAPARYVLNAAGNPVEIEDPPGKRLRWRWSSDAGQPWDALVIEQVDPDGGTTRLRYDRGGNEVERIDSRGVVTQQGWTERFNQLLWRRGPGMERVWNEYDARGNLVREVVQDAGGVHVRRHRYSELGDLLETWTDGALEKRMSYDALGYLSETLRGDGSTERRVHDARGRLVERVDGDGSVHRWEYDTLDRQVRYLHPTRGDIRIAYDFKGNRIEVREGKRVLRTRYDARDREIAQEVDGVVTQTYRYDADGNPLQAKPGEAPEAPAAADEADGSDGGEELPVGWRREGASGEWLHVVSGLRFPAHWQRLARGNARTHDAAGENVSVGYSRADDDERPLWLTLHVYPASAAQHPEPPAHFRELVDSAVQSHAGAELDKAAEMALPLGGAEQHGFAAALRWKEDGREYGSFLVLVPQRGRFVRLRITFLRDGSDAPYDDAWETAVDFLGSLQFADPSAREQRAALALPRG